MCANVNHQKNTSSCIPKVTNSTEARKITPDFQAHPWAHCTAPDLQLFRPAVLGSSWVTWGTSPSPEKLFCFLFLHCAGLCQGSSLCKPFRNCEMRGGSCQLLLGSGGHLRKLFLYIYFYQYRTTFFKHFITDGSSSQKQQCWHLRPSLDDLLLQKVHELSSFPEQAAF